VVKYAAATLLALLSTLLFAAPALAYISLPSSTPNIVNKYLYRNVLETGDWLILVYENTPYTVTPDIDYSEAFVWRFKSAAETVEFARASGYDYNDNGYGYNVISFYLNSANVTALGLTWGSAYKLTLSGTPAAFATPPFYTIDISASDYSSLTATADVKAAIASRIILLAKDLDNKWGLTTDYFLVSEGDTATVLSLYGQSFFRGAVYGLQAMAPAAFPLIVTSVNTADRTWTTTYATALANQYAGTVIETGITAGKVLTATTYNLFGLLGMLGILVVILFANWYLAGGNTWRNIAESPALLVISGRLAMVGMGELGLVVALIWLWISVKIWKVI